MTDRDDLGAARALQLIERELYEKRRLGEAGHDPGLYDEYLRAKREVRVERSDQISVEAMELTTLFLRDLFRANDTIRWVGETDSGLTDVIKSDIIIESALSPFQRKEDLRKPMMQVNAGPSSMPEYVVGSLKSKNFSSGSSTLTGLAAGTIQILISAKNGAQSLHLGEFVRKAIRVHWRYLCSQKWFAITEIALGGYDQNNPMYNRAITSSERNAITPLTFTFFHQWMARSEPRKDAAKLAGIMAVGWGVDVQTPGGVLDLEEAKTKLTVYAGGQIPED